ncbi:hypothetical protein MKZ38_004043 [Zalerion maritima]|uniref:Uncharacterized protein n=1 Tax=Zalerion maritima TaxID=339359 RepID=A0AAD5RM35_9PEZI|nr:hypothetical protein MKZ38_004043 [Zalerion maritima]
MDITTGSEHKYEDILQMLPILVSMCDGISRTEIIRQDETEPDKDPRAQYKQHAQHWYHSKANLAPAACSEKLEKYDNDGEESGQQLFLSPLIRRTFCGLEDIQPGRAVAGPEETHQGSVGGPQSRFPENRGGRDNGDTWATRFLDDPMGMGMGMIFAATPPLYGNWTPFWHPPSRTTPGWQGTTDVPRGGRRENRNWNLGGERGRDGQISDSSSPVGGGGGADNDNNRGGNNNDNNNNQGSAAGGTERNPSQYDSNGAEKGSNRRSFNCQEFVGKFSSLLKRSRRLKERILNVWRKF